MNSHAVHAVSHLIRLLVIGLTIFGGRVFAQIYNVKEMNTEQIKALDREKTVVLLPVGILEEHGPYLPSGSDAYITERRTSDLANALVERPGWTVLIFSLIPLGTGPAKYRWPEVRFPWFLHSSPFDFEIDIHGPRHRLRRTRISLDLYREFPSWPQPQPSSQSSRRLLSRHIRRTYGQSRGPDLSTAGPISDTKRRRTA